MITKDKIILAAIDEFAEHGYQAATVRNICTRAGVNVAAVNYHFSGKAELYRRAIEKINANKPKLPDAEQIVADADIRVVMRKWIKAFVTKSGDEKIISNRQFEKIAYHAMLNPAEIFDEIFDHYIKPDIASLERILKKCLPADTSDAVLRTRMFAILGSCTFYFFHYSLVDKISGSADFMEENIEMITDLITAQSIIGLAIQ